MFFNQTICFYLKQYTTSGNVLLFLLDYFLIYDNLFTNFLFKPETYNMNNNFKKNFSSKPYNKATDNMKINFDTITYEFVSEINDTLYHKLSDIACECNNFDNVKNTFFVDNENSQITINDESDNIDELDDTSENNRPTLILVKDGETIIGFISIYFIDESSAEICGFVLPEYRNNNLGNCLMEKLSYVLEDFYISIPIIKDNQTAPHFLVNNGYHPGLTECSMVINTSIIDNFNNDSPLDFKQIETEDEIIFEISKDNCSIGSCHISIFDNYGCIHNVEINEHFRGNGYGKLLLQYTLMQAKKMCTNIILHVTKENIPAYNLYKKLGFITTSEIIYYDNL